MNEVIVGNGEVSASNALPDRVGRPLRFRATHTVHAFEGGTILAGSETALFSEIQASATACGASSREFPIRAKPSFEPEAAVSLQKGFRQMPPQETCGKASPATAVMLHLRSRYVSKAAILTVPVPRVSVENRSPA
jgi:hypothetical protein